MCMCMYLRRVLVCLLMVARGVNIRCLPHLHSTFLRQSLLLDLELIHSASLAGCWVPGAFLTLFINFKKQNNVSSMCSCIVLIICKCYTKLFSSQSVMNTCCWLPLCGWGTEVRVFLVRFYTWYVTVDLKAQSRFTVSNCIVICAGWLVYLLFWQHNSN